MAGWQVEMAGSDVQGFAAAITGWYADAARDLPWRRPGVSAWGVLVSEVMLQQTPVARVEPAWTAWLGRWPTPADLADAPSGEAVRQWGRLGYPRRALWLHRAATAIVAQHAGDVPRTVEQLRALPGLGAYAAAAVAAFAYDAAVPVLDTNVRRVHARWRTAQAGPRGAAPSAAEVASARALLPASHPGRFSVAVMELGALVCTARSPQCGDCPVSGSCAWLAAGRPGLGEPTGRAQPYAGTDRQVRGLLLAALRAADTPVAGAVLDSLWADAAQRARALQSLVDDGLLVPIDEGYALPH